MGRNKYFSDEEVIEQLADVFVTNGYNGTSLNMLSDASGVGKQSLYNSIGDKREMYLKAVECSAARMASTVSAMQSAATGREALTVFLDRVVSDSSQLASPDSKCIVSSGLTEEIDEPSIASLLRAKWCGTKDLLETTIERGQRDGSIGNRSSAGELALFFITMMSGLRVTARVVDDPHLLRKIVHGALAVLEG